MPDDREIPIDFANLFGSFFNRSPGAQPEPRLLPLIGKPRAYRDSGEESHEVAYRRRVHCGCVGGCPRCAKAGWRIGSEKLTVKVPHGATIGTVLRLPKKGDGAADLHLELVEPGPRADELAELSRTHEAVLDAEWETAVAKNRVERRKNGLSVLVAIGIIGILVGGIYLTSWLTSLPIGEPCVADGQCRSSQCLLFPRDTRTDHHRPSTEGVCTETCASSAACPASMECVGATRRYKNIPLYPAPSDVSSDPSDRYVCAPR